MASKSKKVCLCSKVNYTVGIKYNGSTYVLPPMGRIEFPDETKLEAIPKSVRKIKIQEDK